MQTLKQQLAEIEKNIKEKAKNAMLNEVAEVVRDIEQQKIEHYVYLGYHIDEDTGEITDPFRYQRRREDGGLKDRENMVARIENENTLVVDNITKGQDDTDLLIAPLVNYGDSYGDGYDYHQNRDNTAWQYLRPRPFIEATQETVNKSSEIRKAFKDGLRRNGLDVK